MPGRTPFKFRICGPFDGRQCVDRNLGHFVLKKLEVGGDAKLRIAGKMRPRVLARAEAVHQEEAQVCARLRSGSQHLPGDQVEEGFAIAHNQKRFRLFQAHARAETPIKLQHNGLCKKSSICLP